MWTRGILDSSDQAARLPDRRLRLLSGYALEGSARNGRKGTAVVTRIADSHVPDAVYEEVRPHFSEKELSDLTLAVATINAWNRLSISARTVRAPTSRPGREN